MTSNFFMLISPWVWFHVNGTTSPKEVARLSVSGDGVSLILPEWIACKGGTRIGSQLLIGALSVLLAPVFVQNV